MDGNLNDVKFIGERAVMAAKAINQRHGWKDAMDIRQERIAEVTKACMDVLRSMPFFDWDEYADRLRAKGYDIELIRDKNGQGRVHGYRFKFGKTTIKASELGVGRNLTASKSGIPSASCTLSQHLLQLVKDLLLLFQTLPHWTAEIRHRKVVCLVQAMLPNLTFLPD